MLAWELMAKSKRQGLIMAVLFELLYREYCRARLAEMRKQLLLSAEGREVSEPNCDVRDSPGAAETGAASRSNRLWPCGSV
jgi:hypothetical protein